MIRYFQEDIRFELKQKMQNNRWLKMVAGSEMRRIGAINIIFCSDRYILDVNMKYLQHDYFTDSSFRISSVRCSPSMLARLYTCGLVSIWSRAGRMRLSSTFELTITATASLWRRM